MHTQLIATELSNLGFTTRITQTGVLVSLNRPICHHEVWSALDQTFKGMIFHITKISQNSYHISES